MSVSTIFSYQLIGFLSHSYPSFKCPRWRFESMMNGEEKKQRHTDTLPLTAKVFDLALSEIERKSPSGNGCDDDKGRCVIM
jgi:hypothetical protein